MNYYIFSLLSTTSLNSMRVKQINAPSLAVYDTKVAVIYTGGTIGMKKDI